jgi:penicillin-binding protein 1C
MKLLVDTVRAYRWVRFALAGGAVLVGMFLVADRLDPLPAPGRESPYAMVVLAGDGTPLRAFPDAAYVWRHPVELARVSPHYTEAVIGYEDRAFWWHPGVNPFSLVRAVFQWLRTGHIVSGGSTLTMQVARILDPMPRTVPGKLKQIFRALQLELHYSKREILELYLNYAPMGGVLEGVEAASWGYLGKSSHDLSISEAALLAVLPQKPSLLRPDRYPERARAARDKVLWRMRDRWTATEIQDAQEEPVAALQIRDPLLAPLLAERVKRASRGQTRVATLIDPQIQSSLESLLVDRVRQLPAHVSIACLVLENNSGAVVGYAGSADFADDERFSSVDMVMAARSPGSALKPFLYGFALDDGLIHSESLLSDVPQAFDGYEPANFQQSFHGPVSVSEALTKSLNVPAVQVLAAFGPARFLARLSEGGLKLALPRGAEPNLSLILGGAGVTLENMVGSYAALARGGVAIVPRLQPTSPKLETRMMSPGAAFIVRDILATGGTIGNTLGGRGGRGVAWKTGTSFGFRDAWAFGVTKRYTIGVWVGRPDGTPNPGFFGANVAAPLLLALFDAIPQAYVGNTSEPPASVAKAPICWPSGRLLESVERGDCAIQRTAWVLDGTAPPTLPDPLRRGASSLNYWVDSATALRVAPDCAAHASVEKTRSRWPVLLESWLDPAIRSRSEPPPWSAECAIHSAEDTRLKIFGAHEGEIVERAAGEAEPALELDARGGQGNVSWLLNGRLFAHGPARLAQKVHLAEPGSYDITALDDSGHFDHVHVVLRAQKAG